MENTSLYLLMIVTLGCSAITRAELVQSLLYCTENENVYSVRTEAVTHEMIKIELKNAYTGKKYFGNRLNLVKVQIDRST